MKKTLLLGITLIFLSACDGASRQEIQLVKAMIGRTFLFPDNVKQMIGSDRPVNKDSTFTLVYYLGEDVCNSCRLNAWREYVNELQLTERVKPLLIISPNNDNADSLIRTNNCRFPYYIDRTGEIEKNNTIPHNDAFRSFLLNSDGHIVAIGNPISNEKIQRLFYRIITGNDTLNVPLSVLEVDRKKVDFGDVSLGKNYHTELSVHNSGTNPIVIKNIMTSCDCISASIESNIIYPNQSSYISLDLKPLYPSRIKETVFISCNDKLSPITILVKANGKK